MIKFSMIIPLSNFSQTSFQSLSPIIILKPNFEVCIFKDRSKPCENFDIVMYLDNFQLHAMIGHPNLVITCMKNSFVLITQKLWALVNWFAVSLIPSFQFAIYVEGSENIAQLLPSIMALGHFTDKWFAIMK